MLNCKNWWRHNFDDWVKVLEETNVVSNIWTDPDYYNYKEFIYLQKRTCHVCKYVQIDKQVVYL